MFWQAYDNLVEMGASYVPRKQPLVLKDLTDEVKFHEGDDEQIHKVVDVLSSYGLPPEKIMIKHYPKIQNRFKDTWTFGSKLSVAIIY